MHPTLKKNKKYAGIIFVIAIIISFFCIIRNPYYLIAIGVLAFYTVTLQIEWVPKLVLTALMTIFVFSAIYIVENLLATEGTFSKADQLDQFIQSAIYVTIVMIIPLFVLSIYFVQVVQTAENEKEHYDVIHKHPYVLCTEHHTRTKKYTSFVYKGVKCRVGKKCLSQNHIIPAVNLVGLIGVIETGKVIENDYYVTLWDHRYRKIRYGDYDIIEIHESDEVKDYDFIISKIITFFTNEINRYKPLNRVAIRVIGNPDYDENTKRLLEKHFLKVEYFETKSESVYV